MEKKQPKTIGFFTLSMVVIGSMIGAGLLVVPNQMLSYKFGGTLGWILSAICCLVLARIFADISLSTNGKGGLCSIVAREYGAQVGFISGFAQWMFIIIGSSAILFGLMDYLCEFCNITSHYIQFGIASSIIILISLLHAITTGAMKLMSFVTILKILLFGFCALLGITEFNKLRVFGFNLSGNFMQDGLTLIQNNDGLINLCSNMFKAAAVAMFAFAGIENAASAPNIRNPKKNVPSAAMFGLIVSSVIYLFTHICVVSAGIGQCSTPVKSALVTLSTARFGQGIGLFLGNCVSIIAVLGCFGTLLALGSIMPFVLSESIKLANPDFKTKQSRTGLPFIMSSISVLLIIGMTYCRYMTSLNMRDILLTSNFLLVYFYLQSVLAHLASLNKKILSYLGLCAILILLLGCNPISVMYGFLLVEVLGKVLFRIIKQQGDSIDY